MFYFGDIARFFYPTRVLYANALRSGRLPLWTPELLMGFPLFAEMQTGALYPPHLILYRLLPIDLAINYDILIHLSWLGLGLYLFARQRKTSIPGSIITAMALSAGGFGAGRITHMSVLAVAAWLPWTLLIFEKWRRAPRIRYWVLIAFLFALQFVAGHPQFIFLNAFTFVIYVAASAAGVLDEDKPEGTTKSLTDKAQIDGSKRWGVIGGLFAGLSDSSKRLILAFLPLLAIACGAGMAAFQLIPTAELALASARAGGVSESFFTEFSYNPLYLALLLDPFVLGNPYPRVSVEVIAYLGCIPLVLAGVAMVWRRGKSNIFWLGLAIVCFLLALGGLNPFYRGLRFLPLLNFFRVPARFLYPMSFALAMLAGIGFDFVWLRAATSSSARAHKLLGGLCTLVVVLILIFAAIVDVDAWVSAWRVLAPIFFALALLLVLRAWRGGIGRETFTAFAVGAMLIDLSAFGAVYEQTFNAIAPLAQIFPKPRVLENLKLDGVRTLTSEWKLPWISEMNESLFPNLNAAHGVSSAQGYTPLEPRRTLEFLDNLSPHMLDLLGVRYYMVPQDLPVDPQTEANDLADPFKLTPVNHIIGIMPTEATGLELVSSLAQSANLPDGYVVANIKLTTEDGRVIVVPVRAGLDTAEWAYDRSDVRRSVKHSEPPIATTFPARSAFPVESHTGHTYLANLPISTDPVQITSLEINPTIPDGLIYIERIVLTSGDKRTNIAMLAGKSSHTLVYRSEDVAVFENPDYAPHAFLTHTGVMAGDSQALEMLRSPDYSGELILSGGEELNSDEGQGLDENVEITDYDAESLVLNVSARAKGYVVLTDTWDPGWIALLDGRQVPIQRADVIFRAVKVDAGTHRIEFLYRPISFYLGTIISGTSLALLGLVDGIVYLIGGLARRPDI